MKWSCTVILYLALSVFMVCSASLAGVHIWVDENGVRHFSNTDGPDGDTVVQERTE